MVSFSSNSPPDSRSTSDVYTTVSSAPPKRRTGRTKFRETRLPVYKGVRRRSGDKWVCEVREPNTQSRIWLGTFRTAEMAARAHDVAAIALRGRSACLNFTDSAWRLPVPESARPCDIQRAATEAAEAFGNTVDGEEGTMKVEQSTTVSMSTMAASDRFDMEYILDFGIQGYWDMAQGLLIDPPPVLAPLSAGAEVEGDGDVSLWNYHL